MEKSRVPGRPAPSGIRPLKGSALRRGGGAWQLLRADASHAAMIPRFRSSLAAPLAAAAVLTLPALLASAPALASSKPPPVPGGLLSTLTLGNYTCELPGDAGGPAGVPVPAYSFRIVSSSTYKNEGVRGSYLFIGQRVMMTGGRLKGFALHRISDGFLRKIGPDGKDEDMRCVLVSHTR